MAEERASSFFSGLIAGTIIGFALGILFAPQSGEETRAVLKDKADEWLEKGKEAVEDVKSKGREILSGKGVEIQEEKKK